MPEICSIGEPPTGKFTDMFCKLASDNRSHIRKLRLYCLSNSHGRESIMLHSIHRTALLHLHANADLLLLLFLFFFFLFFFVPATGPLTRYLKTGCSESDQTWQSGRSP